jgi:hypothetical protein
MGIDGPERNSGVDIFQAVFPPKFCDNSSHPVLPDTIMPYIFCLKYLLEMNFMLNGAFGLFMYVEGHFLIR